MQQALKQSSTELERGCTELEKQVSMDEKIEQFLTAYLDCILAAAQNFLAGKEVRAQELASLGDAVRVLNHIQNIRRGL